MVTCLFLDTDDRRHFPEAARLAIRETCDAAEPEIRKLLPGLPDSIEVAAETTTLMVPQTGERGMAGEGFGIECFHFRLPLDR